MYTKYNKVHCQNSTHTRCLCDRASLVQWYQQPTRCDKICFIYSFKLALHVSGRQFRPSSGTLRLYIQSKCCWRWAKLSSEICRASIKETKQMLLHLFGCWYHLQHTLLLRIKVNTWNDDRLPKDCSITQWK